MLPFVAIMVGGMILFAVASQRLFNQTQRRHQWDQLEMTARMASHSLGVHGSNDSRDVEEINDQCVELGRLAKVRLTVIAPDGVVLADSQRVASEMDNLADRPEVRTALRGLPGRGERYSDTLEQWMRYVAVPVLEDGRVTAIVRASIAVPRGITASESLLSFIMIAVVVCVIGAIVFGWLVQRRVVLPLVALGSAIRKNTLGLDRAPDHVAESREITSLAIAVQRNVRYYRRLLSESMEENHKHRSVLTSMSEGLLAIDLDERVVSLNQAGARILKVTSVDVVGRSIQEVVRHSQLQRFIASVRDRDQPMEADLEMIDQGRERFLQARGTALRNAEDRKIGVVIVMNNVTRLRRLENMRRDFAANVSHELKTPITSIKGFIETLQDGAVRDPDKAREFLEIIHRQTCRLEAIIEDLLQLARIERGHETDQLDVVEQPLAPVIETAVAGTDAGLRGKTSRCEWKWILH